MLGLQAVSLLLGGGQRGLLLGLDVRLPAKRTRSNDTLRTHVSASISARYPEEDAAISLASGRWHSVSH